MNNNSSKQTPSEERVTSASVSGTSARYIPPHRRGNNNRPSAPQPKPSAPQPKISEESAKRMAQSARLGQCLTGLAYRCYTGVEPAGRGKANLRLSLDSSKVQGAYLEPVAQALKAWQEETGVRLAKLTVSCHPDKELESAGVAHGALEQTLSLLTSLAEETVFDAYVGKDRWAKLMWSHLMEGAWSTATMPGVTVKPGPREVANNYYVEDWRSAPEGRILAHVKRDSFALRDIPWCRRSKRVCKAVVAAMTREGDYAAIEYLPRRYKTQTLCEAAVLDNSRWLRFVPVRWLTPQLLHQVVTTQEGLPLDDVPTHFLTDDLCHAAAASRWGAEATQECERRVAEATAVIAEFDAKYGVNNTRRECLVLNLKEARRLQDLYSGVEPRRWKLAALVAAAGVPDHVWHWGLGEALMGLIQP